MKILWFTSPHGERPISNKLPPPTLIPCQESPFTCHSSHPICGSPPQENNVHSQFIKKTEWFLLSCWKLYDVESVTWKQISKSDPSFKGMQKAQQEKYSINWTLLSYQSIGLWLSYWMWFQSWWKNNLFWLSRWENFFLWSQHSSCDEDNRGSLCSMHRCCLPPHPTQLGGNLWVGWAG